MPTWKSLAEQFGALETELRHHHIEYRWGGGDNATKLQGLYSSGVTQFESIAELAGRKLADVPADQLPVEVLMQPSGSARWYEALRLRSGMFTAGDTVAQLDRRGIPRGALHTGTLPQPAQASAALAQSFARFQPAAADGTLIGSIGPNGRGGTRPAKPLGVFVVPAVQATRPWWRSWRVAAVAVAVIVAAVITILPGNDKDPSPPAARPSTSAPTAAADDSVLEIQQFDNSSSRPTGMPKNPGNSAPDH